MKLLLLENFTCLSQSSSIGTKQV